MKHIITSALLGIAATISTYGQSSLTYGEPVVQPGNHKGYSNDTTRQKKAKVNNYNTGSYPPATHASEPVKADKKKEHSKQHTVTIPVAGSTPAGHASSRTTTSHFVGNTSVTRRGESLPVTDNQVIQLRKEMIPEGDTLVLTTLDYNLFYPKAQQGDSEAQRRIGLCYLFGTGIERDAREGREWIAKAAVNENTEAQYDMGVIYRDGYGVKENYEEAAYWFRKAARNGNAMAQLSTGLLFYDGKGVQQDYRIAAENFWRAAEQGNVEAAYRLGAMYREGLGMTKDLSKAYFYFNRAASKGEYKDAVSQAEALKQYYKPAYRRGSKGRR